MAPAPAVATGLDPNAVLSSVVSALDEPKTTAAVGGGGAVANVGNAVPTAGGNNDGGGLGGFLTSEIGSILGVGGNGQTSTTSAARAATTTSAARTTSTTSAKAATTSTSTTSTSSSTSTTQKTSTTSTSTPSSKTSSTITSTTPSSSATTPAINTPTTSSLVPTFPTTTSSSPSGSATHAVPASVNAAATTSGLSQPAMIGIIVGAAAVGIFIVLFVLRKLCLARRRRDRVQWEESLGSYNAPKRAGPNEKVEAEVARRLNANVVAPLAPLPAAMPRQQPSAPRSPTSNVTKRPMADMGRPVQIRTPAPPPIAQNMVGPYPVFAPRSSPPQPNRLSGGPVPPPKSMYAVALPPPSLAPSQGTFKTVLTTYSPQLPDELPLTIGERIRVIEVFEDGWAMVERVGPGASGGMMEKGVVPAECLGLGPSQR